MMEALRSKARELLEKGTVQVVIGQAAGSVKDRARPLFARKPEQVQHLIPGNGHGQNPAVYLLKPEVKALGKAALVANAAALRALLQYAVESQIVDGAVIALVPTNDGKEVRELATFAAIEEYLASTPRGLTPAEQQDIDRIAKMSREERWSFWRGEVARCIKCYACRGACPLCYCNRCVVDCNQPQWVPVASDALGNLEWNAIRAMHLAGRCINCGSCAEACPEGIRIDLLNHVLAQEAMAQFAAEPGYSTRKEYALSVYKPDDKEDFIR
jgi:formate dehydrogenase (coenzyme F420) beta subunit